MLIHLCEDKFYPDDEARGHYHYDPAVHNYARPEWCKGWRKPSEREWREFLVGSTKSNQENKMLFHKCDGKVYLNKTAFQHPHSTCVLPCTLGWRAATDREEQAYRQAERVAYDREFFQKMQDGVSLQLNVDAFRYALGLTPPLAGERHPIIEERLTAPLNLTVTPAPPTDNYRRITGAPQKPETPAKPQEGSSNPTLTQEEAKRVIVTLQDVKKLLVSRNAFNSARKVRSAIAFIGGVQRLLPNEKDERVEVVDTINTKTGQVVSREIGGRKYAMNPVLGAPYNFMSNLPPDID